MDSTPQRVSDEVSETYQKQLNALSEAALALIGARDLQQIVQSATDAATQVSGAKFGAFFYNDVSPTGEKYMLYTISGVPREHFSKFPMPRNTAIFAPTFNGERIVRSDDITKDPAFGKSAPHYGMPQGHLPIRSYLAVPVYSRSQEVIGGLFFGHSEVGVFDETSERLVASIAAQAGVAIDNARLHESLTKQIAEHQAARMALSESDARFRRAQKAASIGAWYWDLKTHQISWSTEVPSLIGALPESSFASFLAATDERDRPEVLREIERAMREGGHFQIESRINPLAGQQVWLLTEGDIVLDEHGAADYGVGISMDTTAKHEAEMSLAKAEQRFRLVLASTHLGFWYCDLPFDKLRWDTTVKEHFWLPPDAEVTIEMFFERIHPEDRERTRDAIQRSIDERGTFDMDYRTVSETGEIKWIRAVGRSFYGSDGAPVSFDGVTMDVTGRRMQEDALRNSEKLAATGRLAATIAHEINNPLEAVTNFIYLARTRDGLDEQVQEYLQLADQELARVTHIAQQTLGFYRDSSAPRELDICVSLSDVLSIYQRKLQYKDVRVQLEAEGPLRVTGLTGEIRQIFSNIIANAIDAAPEASRIRVRARSASHSGRVGVRVSICDEGPGIRREDISKIYQPFFTTKTQVGTGLGLWVTRSIVENHGGSIRVWSRSSPPTGTVFSVFLPEVAETRRGSLQ
ncbi:MAG TPA: ATP-binding protein [Terriglobales bacterium]